MKTENQNESLEQKLALMFWKLCLGDPNHILLGEGNPTFNKTRRATAEMFTVKPMPDDDISRIPLALPIHRDDMAILRMGHIPEVQEDHWFMYCTDEHICYFRSWSGVCMYEAHFRQEGEDYIIDSLLINRGLVEFGLNGDDSAVWLFRYLLTTEIGGDTEGAWQDFVNVWLDHNH